MPKHDKVADPGLRDLFQRAHGEMTHGQPTEAVHTLSDCFVTLLQKKPEILAAKSRGPIDEIAQQGGWIDAFSPALKWPQLGANLVEDSVKAGHPRIEFTVDQFTLSQAFMYYEFAVDTALQYQA